MQRTASRELSKQNAKCIIIRPRSNHDDQPSDDDDDDAPNDSPGSRVRPLIPWTAWAAATCVAAADYVATFRANNLLPNSNRNPIVMGSNSNNSNSNNNLKLQQLLLSLG